MIPYILQQILDYHQIENYMKLAVVPTVARDFLFDKHVNLPNLRCNQNQFFCFHFDSHYNAV
jgi:hypothetical protein